MNPLCNSRVDNVTWKNDEFKKNGTASISSPEALPTRQVERVMVQILSLTKSTKESNVDSVEQLPQLKREHSRVTVLMNINVRANYCTTKTRITFLYKSMEQARAFEQELICGH